MKWYWIVLIVLVSVVIGYWLKRQADLRKAIAFHNAVNSGLRDVSTQLQNTNAGGGRMSSAVVSLRTKLVSQRDALLRLKNPTPSSINVLVWNGSSWSNGWGPVPTPKSLLTGGAKCKAEGNYWIYDPTILKYICSTSQNPY